VEKKVHFTVDGKVGIITLANPPYNLLSGEVILGIDRIWSDLRDEKGVSAVILTGEGDCFSYGTDIKEINEVKEAGQMRDLCVKGHTIFNRFWASGIPTIAALNGKCLGGGLEIALACHFRVADEGIRLGFPEIRLGLIPGWGGTQRMARIAGPSIALEYVITGRMMDPGRAMELGIVNEISPAGESLKVAKKLARRIGQKSRHAVRAALDTVTKGIEMDLAEALKHEAGCFGRLSETSEAKEGLRAFFEGRRAKFEND
jgi:enoyl-CoA hydratase/carnithine racemase